jgi:hypothetical protein
LLALPLQALRPHPGSVEPRTKELFVNKHFRALLAIASAVVCCVALGLVGVHADTPTTSTIVNNDPTGTVRTISTLPVLDTTNPFFQPQGTNGRACVTCHDPNAAWSVSAQHIRQRFVASAGTDPIFRPVDGATCPDDDVSNLGAKLHAYSLLLQKGLIRVGLSLPPNPEFSIAAVDDPNGCAYRDGTVSVYRRPLPSTNLRFQTTVMWDGRETRDNLVDSLTSQAHDAILGHQQGAEPSDAVLQQIVAMEMSFYSAQDSDTFAGPLNANGATAGALPLVSQVFYPGINDVLGGDPNGLTFNPTIFSYFGAWSGIEAHDVASARRASIARGEAIFNSRVFSITGVAGLNDIVGMKAISGTCGSCHDTPAVGNHSARLPINIGLTDASQRTPDLPLFTLRNNVTGQTVQTTDPGLALITGKWTDIGKFKGSMLRGLSSRAPYFHNGSAATLEDVVSFYDTRFHIGLTRQDKADLVAFLSSL